MAPFLTGAGRRLSHHHHTHSHVIFRSLRYTAFRPVAFSIQGRLLSCLHPMFSPAI